MIPKALNSKILLFLTVVLIAVWAFNDSNRYFLFISKKQVENYPVISDGSGYYAYLPQWFIYHTDNFEFIDSIQKKYPNARFSDGFSYNSELQKKYNKYFIGTAILQAPSFLLAHGIATITDQPTDGYSTIYQFFITVNTFIFTFLGLFAVFKTLHFFNLSRFTKLVTVFVLFAGTNLSYFTLYNPAFSHAYSFFAISTFIYMLFKWRAQSNALKYLPILAILLGLVFLIRPSDVIVGILLPFFLSSVKQFRPFIRSVCTKKGFLFLFVAIGLFLFLISLQAISTYQQRNIWAFNNYTGEGFDNLFSPEIVNVLFSVRKGLFVYAPILLIAIIGFIPLWKKDRFLTSGILLFLLLFTYVTASWWCWWYGGGLGMRPYINILIFFALPFGVLFETSRNYFKPLLLLLSLACVILYQIFQKQMVQNILHYDDMTRSQFQKVFLETGHRFDWSLHREFDSLPVQKPKLIQETYIENKKKETYHDFQPDNNIKISIYPNTNYKQWAGKITGQVKITHKDQNPNFDVKYLLDSNLVKQESFFFGGEIPSVGKFHPITINFNPKGILYDKVEITLYPNAETLYFKQAVFQSFYYE